MSDLDPHDRINLTGPWAGFGFQGGHMFTPEGQSLGNECALHATWAATWNARVMRCPLGRCPYTAARMPAGRSLGGTMDRERQEPTFSSPDMKDMHFRDARTRQIAMGLIEWNARRQAAAITRELMRPISSAEQARFNAEMQTLDRDLQQSVREAMPQAKTLYLQSPAYTPLPLRQGECIQGRRLERIERGWRDRPNEPC